MFRKLLEGLSESLNSVVAVLCALLLLGIPGWQPAFINFCAQYREQCAVSPGIYKKISIEEIRDILEEVNRNVNSRITYKTEEVDAWNVLLDPPGDVKPRGEHSMYGDCDDYAVTKQYELMKRGIPSRALRLTVAWYKKTGEGHLTLTVVDDYGRSVVLDNNYMHLTTWQEMAGGEGFEPIAWQSAHSPIVWRLLPGKTRNIVVAK